MAQVRVGGADLVEGSRLAVPVALRPPQRQRLLGALEGRAQVAERAQRVAQPGEQSGLLAPVPDLAEYGQRLLVELQSTLRRICRALTQKMIRLGAISLGRDALVVVRSGRAQFLDNERVSLRRRLPTSQPDLDAMRSAPRGHHRERERLFTVSLVVDRSQHCSLG